MGRWTPLVLMAGGLAILLGTLLGISFPMDGKNAQAPKPPEKESSVLPANINVNSTTAKQSPANANDSNTVAQNPQGTDQEQDNNQTTDQENLSGNGNGTGEGDGNGTGDGIDGGEPIRALW